MVTLTTGIYLYFSRSDVKDRWNGNVQNLDSVPDPQIIGTGGPVTQTTLLHWIEPSIKGH